MWIQCCMAFQWFIPPHNLNIHKQRHAQEIEAFSNPWYSHSYLFCLSWLRMLDGRVEVGSTVSGSFLCAQVGRKSFNRQIMVYEYYTSHGLWITKYRLHLSYTSTNAFGILSNSRRPLMTDTNSVWLPAFVMRTSQIHNVSLFPLNMCLELSETLSVLNLHQWMRMLKVI